MEHTSQQSTVTRDTAETILTSLLDLYVCGTLQAPRRHEHTSRTNFGTHESLNERVVHGKLLIKTRKRWQRATPCNTDVLFFAPMASIKAVLVVKQTHCCVMVIEKRVSSNTLWYFTGRHKMWELFFAKTVRSFRSRGVPQPDRDTWCILWTYYC